MKLHLTSICDTEEHFGRGHFCVIYMKFSSNIEIEEYVDYLNFKIKKILDLNKNTQIDDDINDPFLNIK